MKRYSTTSIRAYEPAEDPNGEWVRYKDAQAEIKRQLEAHLIQSGIVADLRGEIERLRNVVAWHRKTKGPDGYGVSL